HIGQDIGSKAGKIRRAVTLDSGYNVGVRRVTDERGAGEPRSEGRPGQPVSLPRVVGWPIKGEAQDVHHVVCRPQVVNEALEAPRSGPTREACFEHSDVLWRDAELALGSVELVDDGHVIFSMG